MNQEPMLSAGRNIQSTADPLSAITVDYLYKSLREPQPEIESRIRQLRIVRQMDGKLYSKNKKLLPYFVCGVFNPAIRRTENFAYTSYFVIDLDNLAERQLDLFALRSKIELDSRVMLSFVSPSEDGLKVIFKLKNRCFDTGIYKLFYKEFLRKFSEQYHLDQVVDERTCDVCRACFVSIDRDAYFNPSAELVDINDYLHTDNPVDLFDLKKQQAQEAKEQEKQEPETLQPKETEPEDDTLAQIKEYLKMRQSKPAAPKLPIYVPERLEQLMTGLKSFIEDQGLEVYDLQDIQYGKKIRVRYGNKLAEANLFYGKHGFKTVQVVKGILSSELNDILVSMIDIFLMDNV